MKSLMYWPSSYDVWLDSYSDICETSFKMYVKDDVLMHWCKRNNRQLQTYYIYAETPKELKYKWHLHISSFQELIIMHRDAVFNKTKDAFDIENNNVLNPILNVT